ncbi:hypothetical protein B0H19DRAFT_1146496 [Mycena capillaripes]|nr:hypothetical protein B0H19DRAFT_1146496 [Mycena capillaripes]
MTTTSGVPNLPNDILDRILQWAPTFQTLQTAILVSKGWYQVFQTHPKSIIRSVAKNVVGPALPDAVRVLRYSCNTATKGSDDDMDALTGSEFRCLQTNAAMVRQLEVAFSSKYRDPLSRTSQLSWMESWRFARAMYRIMLYCDVFRMPDDEDQVIDLEENQHIEIETRRVVMLSEYSTQELFELSAALVFLRAIAYEVSGDHIEEDDDMRGASDMLISTGPATVLEAYQQQGGDRMVEAVGYTVWIAGPFSLLLDFFTGPLQRIWDERAVAAPPRYDAALQGSLLDDFTYRSAPCDQCAGVSPNKLRKEADWDDLNVNIRKLFLGNLADNFIEMEPLGEEKPERDIPKLIAELYALKTEEFKGWEKSDALCDACLTKFLSAHLHLWLLDRKLKDGWEAAEDCWYGYNCRTQTEVTLHAMTKNHLCAPTRPCE